MRNKKDAALGFIFITLLIDSVGLGIIIPIMPDLIKGMIHDDLSKASVYGGWLTFAYAFMQFICAPVMGGLSDKYGRRVVLLCSLFGFGIDYLFLALAPSIGWLFVGRIIAGMMGASFTTASAYIADISSPEKKAQNFGLIGAAFGLGFIIGPGIGGQLSHFGLRFPFYAAAALALFNWLYGFFILPESLPRENRREFEWKRANPFGSLRQLFKYKTLNGLIIALIFVYIAAHAIQSTWTFYSMEKFNWTPQAVGYSLTFVGVILACVQGGLIRVIIPRLGQERSVYTGLLMTTLGLILIAFATQGWMMYAFIIPYALGGITGPSIQAIISEQIPKNEQGELQGALTSLMSATSIFGPVMMTYIFRYFTSNTAPVVFPGAPFAVGAVLTSLSALIAYQQLRVKPVFKI